MKQLIIMRGLPGSGKSTFVKTYFKHAAVCSADHFFTDNITGEYRFDPSKLKQAHKACFDKFVNMVEAEHPLIVIDNTNSQLWEYQNYLVVTEAHSYSVATIELQCDVNTAFQRGIHGVPMDAIERMAKRWE